MCFKINMKQVQKKYAIILFSLFFFPNAFFVILGIESFPLTCAHMFMFGHYIDENTNLYEFKFEGVKDGKTTELIDFLGKPEDHFMRHFFSKVYGSIEAVSPFTNKLSENAENFQNRMDMFFQLYESNVLLKKYHLSFDHINLKAVRINQERQLLTTPELIGYYDCFKKTYKSAYNKASLSQITNKETNGTY